MKAAKIFSFLLLCFVLACTAATNSADQRKANDSATKSASTGAASKDEATGDASKGQPSAGNAATSRSEVPPVATFENARTFIEQEIQKYLPLIGTKDEPADKSLKAKVIALIQVLESLNEFGEDLPAYIEHVRGLLGRESNPAAIDALQGVLKHLGAGSGDDESSQDAGSQNKATQAKAFNTATFPFSPRGNGRASSQKKATERAAEKTDASSQAPPKKNNTATFPF